MRLALPVIIGSLAAPALAQPINLSFSQNFESGTQGLATFNAGTLARVPSGTAGLSAPQGQFFAQSLLNSSNSSTPGGGGGSGFRVANPFAVFSSSLPAPSGYQISEFSSSIKYFIDPTAGSVGDWWASTATHDMQRGFWFQKSSSNTWHTIATFDTAAIDSTTFADLTQAGWYTFESIYSRPTTDGSTDLRYIIRAPDGSIALNATRSIQMTANLALFNWGTSWVLGNDSTIAADDLSFNVQGQLLNVVPLPSATALAGVTLMIGAARTRRR